MNKFEMILGDEALKNGDVVKFCKNWKNNVKSNLWAHIDPFLNDDHKFLIIHQYSDEVFHVRCLESGHENIVHQDWIQKTIVTIKQDVEELVIGDRVILRSGWESKTRFTLAKKVPHMYNNTQNMVYLVVSFDSDHLDAVRVEARYPNGRVLNNDLFEKSLVKKYNAHEDSVRLPF